MAKTITKIAKSTEDKVKLANEYLRDEGMTAFNSALRAGLTPEQAIRYEEKINKSIIFKRFTQITARDIAERKGVTYGALYDKLSEAAGIGFDRDGVARTGATKIVSAMKKSDSESTDFIEVPDWYCRIRAVHELALLGEFIKRSGTLEGGEDNSVNIDKLIIIRPANGEHKQERIIEMNVSAG